MRQPSRSCLLAAALAAAVTVPAVAGTALAGPAAAAGPRKTLVIWGADHHKILGPRAGMGNATRPRPFPIPGSTVREARVGCDSGYVLTTSGRILAWGDDNVGQLGDGHASPHPTATPAPVRLPSGTHAVSVQPACDHVVAVLSTGKVVAWGRNDHGQLGDNDPGLGAKSRPVAVDLPGNVKFKAACAGFDFSMALSATGQVWAWGDNQHGQLGNGITEFDHPVPGPVKLPAGTRVTAISCGFGHTLALTSAGRVLAWGEGSGGELGSAIPRRLSRVPLPANLPARVRIRSVFAAAGTSMALSTTGQVWTWGFNDQGQLGNGSTVDHRRRPGLVRLPARTTVRQITGGADYDLALTTRGTILAWGRNDVGELGIGKATPLAPRRVPVTVHLPAGQTAVYVGTGWDSSDALAVTRSRR
jgi:alpha-tubulin suppressor-like RCC1 family protein